MSKKIVFIIVILIILLIGFSILMLQMSKIKIQQPVENEATETFKGIVEEVYDKSVLVKVDQGETITSSGDKVIVGTAVLGDTKLSLGDYIEVTYDGQVMESWPLQINVISIKIISTDKVAKMYEKIIEHLWQNSPSLNTEATTENEAIISMVKYRSGLGAIFPKYKLNYKNGEWQIKVICMAIS